MRESTDFSGETISILRAVEHEFDMSGLSAGLYGEYAAIVAGRILFAVLSTDIKQPLSAIQITEISTSIQEALDD